MLPSFYPTALLILLTHLTANCFPNTKYILQYMIKHHQQITKHHGFRQTTCAKVYLDVYKACTGLHSDVPAFSKFYYHPQTIVKHETRPKPWAGKSDEEKKKQPARGQGKKQENKKEQQQQQQPKEDVQEGKLVAEW